MHAGKPACAMHPQLLSYRIFISRCFRNDPQVWFVVGLRPSFCYLVGPKGTPPINISRHPQDVHNVDSRDLKRDHEFPFKGLSQIIAPTYFQWSMKDVGCLVNISDFEFLCRKLNFVHVGIVQIFIFFIKSARRFRKTISTLASQRVAWIPGIPRTTTMHFWTWEPWMMRRKMHGWQTWSIR